MSTRRGKSRNFWIGSATALAVIAAAVLPQLRHPPSTLLARAHKVAALGTWDPAHDNYFWLSPQSVLVVMQGHQLPGGGNPPVSVQRLSVSTGSLTKDVPLEAALHKANVTGLVPHWQLSPDACWLLGEAYHLIPHGLWVATKIDGTRQVVRPHQHLEHEEYSLCALWRPDSRSWLQTTEGYAHTGMYHTEVYLYQLDHPKVITQTENFSLDGESLVGFFGADRILAIKRWTGDGGGVEVADFGDVPASAPAKFYLPHVPANMDVQEVVMSPDHTHLAWKFTVKPLPLGIEATINSNYVRYSAPYEAGLWTSDLNFNHLHEVGTIGTQEDKISTVRWTPDGKSLSFVDNNALYTVSVN